MNRHVQGIIALGIVVVISCAIGISVVGTPLSQRLINFDNTRIADFSRLKYQIEGYYRTNSVLPLNITDLERTGTVPKDPETGNQYEYHKVTETSYKFCTVFSTDSEQIDKRQGGRESYAYPAPGGTDTNHTKGYDCISYILPDHILKTATPTPYGDGPIFRPRPMVTVYP